MMKPSTVRHPPAADTRNRPLSLTIMLCLSVIAASAICASCSGQNDSDKIRTLIDNGAALAQAHDIEGMLELATADVRAMPMNLDRRGIKGVLWRTFKYYGPMTILYPRPAVEIDAAGHGASARVPFLIVKKEHPFKDLEGFRDDPVAWVEAIGDAAGLYRLQLQLTSQNGDWQVAQVVLERFTGRGWNE